VDRRLIEVNQDRLQRDMQRLSRIGMGERGITRRSYTPEDVEARSFVAGLMQEASLDVRIDAVGNLFGRRQGAKPDLPVIMVGSHIDTVPQGGMFDGALGVLGGIEAVRAMNEAGVCTEHPVEVVSFAEEEGAWGSGTLGSRVFVGDVRAEELDRVVTGANSLKQLMLESGLEPDDFENAARPYPVAGYIELHVEQGGVLEQERLQIGIVTGIVGITRGSIVVQGKANHAGTTPMHMRDDALVKAAPLITYVYQEALRQESVVATIGRVGVSPGAVNVIPGKVELSLELRSMDDSKVELLLDRIRRKVELAEQAELRAGLAKGGVKMHALVMQAIENVCRGADVLYKKMPSGAGHDAMCMARICPTGMLFVPSKGGMSHSPDEFTHWADAARGAMVLANAVIDLDSTIS